MVSFIVIAKDKKKREAYSKDYAIKMKIDPIDITIVEKDTTKKTTQSIGIEDIKKMQEKIFLKPLRSQTKIIVLEDAHFLTPEAQNALLKVLEEPPANTHIFLGTESKETFLPTILSRCQLIELEGDKPTLSEKTIEELNEFITALPEMPFGERLKYAEQYAKDKEKAIAWITNLIIVLREQLIDTYTQTKPSQAEILIQPATIKSLQSLHTLLKTTNVNPRFAVEHTLLSL